MIPTLPLAPRNRLAELILAALHDEAARHELRRLAPGDTSTLTGWLAPEEACYAPLLGARARSACQALEPRPLHGLAVSLGEALGDAGALWEAGLYFEVHELLEPYWRDATGATREALQGLIQAAVGYQHLANGNLPGARALLGEGADRLRGRALAGRALDAFAKDVAASVARIDDFDSHLVPRFPG